MEIYQGRREDLDFISIMWGKLVYHHRNYRDYMEPSQYWRQLIVNLYLSDMMRDDRLILIAKERNRYLGFIRIEIRRVSKLFSGDVVGYISDLYVEQNYRGSGVADKLILEAINWLKKKGIRNVRLNVSSENFRAINFYKKMGFIETNKTLSLEF